MKFGGGKTGRDYTYVSDIVAGLVAAVDRPFDFEVINLGNSSPVSLNDLIETMEKVTGKRAQINELPLQPGDVKLTYAHIGKARRLLGYEPKTDLLTGLRRLHRWYMEEV